MAEHPGPFFSLECTNCELSQHSSRMIWGEGNPHAPVMVLLDNPGAREDRYGVPFLCGTRQTLQELALQAGIDINDLYITYVVKCRPIKSYNKEKARAVCLEYFHQQVAEQSPQILFCLGNVAVQALLRKEVEVKALRTHWHNWSGIPLAVSYHPLAVRRRPNLFNSALQDWVSVAKKIVKDK